MPIPISRALLALATFALVAGCTSAIPDPTDTTSWRDPSYTGPGFSRFFVVGLSAQSLEDQRGFEDLLVSALRDGGAGAVPGWQFVPQGSAPDQATMRAAVARAGADAVLLVRISPQTTEGAVGYSPGVVTAVAPDVYVGWYGPGIASVEYQAATVFTTLFDVASARPVWTYNPPTYGPGAFAQQAPGFAAEVVGRLRTSGLLRMP